jgi:dienelactone hydrolase
MQFPEIQNGAESRTVQIPCGAAVLEGQLSLPSEARGVVLFAHGSGSSRHSPRNQAVAQAICKAGTGTLLFDLLTGAEEAEDSITARLRFDINLLAKRLVQATMWVLKQPETERAAIGYFGSSTGGAAALVAAAQLGHMIGAVVSRGGRVDLAGGALRRVQAPTLMIVGGLDDTVLSWNREALEALDCEKRLAVIPGATHLFEEPGALEQVAQLAAKWFRRHLH